MPELREAGGKKLVGSACASDEAGDRWLAAFMGLVGNDGRGRPDSLGVHYYSGDVEHAKSCIVSMREKYGLPLNISEIASVSREREAVEGFTEELRKWMDAQEWIDEYGWFGCMANCYCADDFVSPAAQLRTRMGVSHRS